MHNNCATLPLCLRAGHRHGHLHLDVANTSHFTPPELACTAHATRTKQHKAAAMALLRSLVSVACLAEYLITKKSGNAYVYIPGGYFP